LEGGFCATIPKPDLYAGKTTGHLIIH
jgi:hypothetical protein